MSSSAAFVLLVLVAKGEGGAETAAMAGAVKEAVLVDAQVELREVASMPKDDDAVALARDAHATAVVALVWRDAGHRSATLHFHAEAAPRWTDRHLAFEATDSDADRGRTMGFAVVSMLPEALTRPPPPLPPAPRPEPPAEHEDGSASDRPASTPAPRETWKPEDFVPPRWNGAFDLAAAMRAGSDASGYGAALSARWDFASRLSARAGAAVHAGRVSSADASSLAATLGAGLVARPVLASRARPFELAVRSDLLLQRVEIDHAEPSGSTVSGSRWAPGADAAVDVMWVFAWNFGVFLAGGAELAFGKTTVLVAGTEVAAVAPLRAVADAGIRVLF
jgi:hypothetical protein